jgi:hypothetical protein
MKLTYKTRRRLALIILVIGLPLYIVLAVTLVSWFDRPSLFVELIIYICLGMVWAFPLKFIFLGVGQKDPDKQTQDDSI